MSGRTLAIVVLGAVTMLLDGFDNQLLGFAVLQIVDEFGSTRAEFGWVFAVGFVGIGVGTALGGLVGDRIGRKPCLILAVLVFGTFTLISATTGGTLAFACCRIVAGAGLGMALPAVTSLVAEFTPARWRHLATAVSIACIPGGALVGGLVGAAVLPRWGWQELYLIGGVVPLLLVVVLALVLLESPQFLAARGPRLRGHLRGLRPGRPGPLRGGGQCRGRPRRTQPRRLRPRLRAHDALGRAPGAVRHRRVLSGGRPHRSGGRGPAGVAGRRSGRCAQRALIPVAVSFSRVHTDHLGDDLP